ncbi:FeoA family protein [Halanaerobium congolense]|jgi:ferrous iron transport protein A|uniref:Ferrous iron transport protein A n=1 Tax=Halanaerobium congolense TaxID=54121 RepID=A0A1G6JRC9_9FIRM|nr:FeoA family protein [Halanaerobium congolense]KXS49049.1 MAG: ferrous iron transport protein A [Halanaerobium sp. T82-1]PUU93529.1 MAG: ferrous iron transport protein A [Halanaerobium sp.]PTX16153.1 ferrous iron transport protein A [Halanaerobium congolense]PXV65159.1 ferrous iron transport protein A [Halanaerobium congolense]TDP25943.1 ferrous iron transport protein A [Halanaerobium congolense]
MPLAMLRKGETACIKEIIGGRTAKGKLTDLGFVSGKKVKIHSSSGGPLIVALGDNRVALGHGLAHKVMVDTEGCES